MEDSPKQLELATPAGNWDKWAFYMKDIKSPDLYIKMGFYSMISAALQRRVWLFSEERPLFPNMYILLVGPPAVGKGLVLKPINEILTFFKQREEQLKDSYLNDPQALARRVELSIYDQDQKTTGDPAARNGKSQLAATLFPVASDSMTFEALIQKNAQSVRFHKARNKVEEASAFMKKGRYKHCSMAFCLEEISTLFRKKAEEVVVYFIKAFDCQDYVHETKTQGTDIVTRCCLSFLGGTTPSFIRDTFDNKIFGDGFASRIIAVYASKNRFSRFDMGQVSKDQLKAKSDLIAWVLKLHSLFGKVTYSAEAYEFMKDYVENRLERERPNKNPMLDSYYGRKDIHVQKLAMAMHFAEYLTKEIQVETCRAAIALLDELEVTMDKALVVSGRNQVGSQVDAIRKFIEKNYPVNKYFILGNFIQNINMSELDELLEFLLADGKIKTVTVKKKGKTIIMLAPNKPNIPDEFVEDEKT